MELLVKILLSSTLIVAINFVTRTVTSSHFDRIFMAKYQKVLQNICIYIILFVSFTLYGGILAAIYSQVKNLKYTPTVIGSIIILDIFCLITVGIICLNKKIVEKKHGTSIKFSENKVTKLMFVPILLNIITFSVIFCEMYMTSRTNKWEYYSNIINCTILFFILTAALLKAINYLIGYRKKNWSYVLSPTPEDVDKKYLYVLYSLSPTQLVLSDDNENIQYPTSVYVYDISKQSFVHFERVLTLKRFSSSNSD